MLPAIRFLWNSMRGHRLAPWRSEFMKWRIETFTGYPAEQIKGRDVISFLWATRWEVLNFLAWINRTHKVVAETNKKAN